MNAMGVASQSRRRSASGTVMSRVLRAPRARILFLVSVVTIGLAGGVHALLAPARFPVRMIRFTGHFQNVPRDRLVAVASPFLQKNFYGLNLDAVTTAVHGVPWVGMVSVERRFPRTLVVHIADAQLVAHWAAGGFVSAAGEHLHLDGHKLPVGLPVFAGPRGAESKMVDAYMQFKTALAPLSLRVIALRLSARRTWRLKLAHGPVLVLGHHAQKRLTRFAQVFPQISDRLARMRRIDLRYTNGFAVSWRKALRG
ncbi:MAG: cell division protein FtsQ/DivIB [Acidiferrobacter sp.]